MAKWKKRKDLSTKHNPEIKIHQHAGNLDELMCSRRISNYCSSTSGTHRITRIAIPVIRHERRNKDFCVTTTNRTYLYRRTMRTYLYRRTMRTYLYRRTWEHICIGGQWEHICIEGQWEPLFKQHELFTLHEHLGPFPF